jgi:hypothetical protein
VGQREGSSEYLVTTLLEAEAPLSILFSKQERRMTEAKKRTSGDGEI